VTVLPSGVVASLPSVLKVYVCSELVNFIEPSPAGANVIVPPVNWLLLWFSAHVPSNGFWATADVSTQVSAAANISILSFIFVLHKINWAGSAVRL
jgi:hypothetical protein